MKYFSTFPYISGIPVNNCEKELQKQLMFLFRLDRTLSLFNRLNSGHVAVFGNLGSMGGLQALRKSLCHIASSHLLQEDEQEYNFDFAFRELDRAPAVDDPEATPGDLDALAGADEAAWLAEREAVLLYR